MQIIEVSGWSEVPLDLWTQAYKFRTLEDSVQRFKDKFGYEPSVVFHFGDTYAIVIDPDYRVGKDGE